MEKRGSITLFCGVLCCVALALPVAAADLMASTTPPMVGANVVTEWTSCPSVGMTAFASNGALLACQGGVWMSNKSFFGEAVERLEGVVYYSSSPGLLVTIPLDQACICGNYHYVYTGNTSNPTDLATHVKSYSHYGTMATGTTPIRGNSYYRVHTYYGAAPLRIMFFPLQ